MNQVNELRARVRELKGAVAAQSEIQDAFDEGRSRYVQRVDRELAAAHDRATLAESREQRALQVASETAEHVGQVYRRIKQIGDLARTWGQNLPPEFYGELLGLTDPDFVDLLGVRR